MAYVAVKGGSRAIEASLDLWKAQRLGGGARCTPGEIQGGLRLLVDQVMSEASLYDPETASFAVRQAEGSPEEAVFLLRAFRSTVPRNHYSRLIESVSMRTERRISAAFKDIPGGQLLGPSCDYSHRLIEFTLDTPAEVQAWLEAHHEKYTKAALEPDQLPKVIDYLRTEGLLKEESPSDEPPSDITKKSLEFPAKRSERLQILTRGQTGAVTALGYASLRGYGALHPTVGELRVGRFEVCVPSLSGEEDANPEEDYFVGEFRATEVETLVPVETSGRPGTTNLEFEIGYGFCFGQNETKAIAMSLLDQCLETGDPRYPTHDEEFVLLHIDSVEATGFISHLKLPHYVTFQSKLESLRESRRTKAGQP